MKTYEDIITDPEDAEIAELVVRLTSLLGLSIIAVGRAILRENEIAKAEPILRSLGMRLVEAMDISR